MEYEITHSNDRSHTWNEEGAQPEEAVNPVALAHRCLRGRYPLALALALVLAVPFAILGYIAVPPKYTSTGRVNIVPERTPVMYQNEFNEMISAFDSFVQNEANTLRSWRIIEHAMQNPKLRAARWPTGPAGAVELMEGLSVSVPRGSQNILISVTHEDPKKAKAAVDAVLESYEEISINEQARDLNNTLAELRSVVRKFETDAGMKRDEAFRIAKNAGTDDLERRRAAKHAQVEMLERLILDYDVELVLYKGIGEDAAPEQAAPDRDALPPELLAENDRALGRLLDQRRSLEMERDALLRRYAPGHRAVLQIEDELEILAAMIEGQAELARLQPGLADAAAQLAAPALKAQRLREQRAELVRLRDRTRDEATELGEIQLSIKQLREEAARAEEQLSRARTRLDGLEIEMREGSIGRISIVDPGSPPLKPSTDRRIPLAVMGGLGGAGLGVASIGLLGFLSPRYRFIGDLDDTTRNVFVFGAVPELDAADPESRELVAASVHQVRSVIDARLLGTSDRALVHAVTSAGAAEGKSTIALRLARSFAATGRKTLLIDGDMIGRRLSAEFHLLGEGGFADAVTGAAGAGNTVHETGMQDLFLMPCGRTDLVDPEAVSARRVGDLLEPLQQVFHAIVIDTGPILGSLEAQAISAASDEVMLVVTRGREVRQVKLAIDRLHRLGTRKIGVVFNRATRQDMERSTSISATSHRTTDARAHWEQEGLNGNGATAPLLGEDAEERV